MLSWSEDASAKTRRRRSRAATTTERGEHDPRQTPSFPTKRRVSSRLVSSRFVSFLRFSFRLGSVNAGGTRRRIRAAAGGRAGFEEEGEWIPPPRVCLAHAVRRGLEAALLLRGRERAVERQDVRPAAQARADGAVAQLPGDLVEPMTVTF